MHISWLGNSAIKIQTKPIDEDVTVVIDPYRPEKGNFPRSLSPQLGLYTRGEENSITLSGDPFVLTTPGECETKGVLVTAVQGHEEGQVFLRVDSEYLSVGHLGNASKQLTDAQLEVLADVDVLIIPVGGHGCYNAEDAVKTVNAVEPRIVIPMMFKSDIDPDADPVSSFLKAYGAKDVVEEVKTIIKKKDLPQEDTRVIVLTKE
ncbi:MAG: Zn-dependent hydrolase of the beta-lactamase fold-like protein [Candidatus Magasanikbacteria bacterium GW2011_GWD2_43_18]|uniref:Zn-dependent hydrolase of the beta-lactamase fold-like protein n=1 Tax=Candidatus Magasanikbacteria bacterium GW2011_GWE2_42_7 TaxID=1619052 RepID=A0A0G1BHP5_9BACT|nr:MAG: Zn-dependent hydrolase of the beta-lactamase fold-like protein [Candidatus Magasanikbacteria bacterium GW2011_GWC2_42_27]KKS72709.1 MAG: Zn-dependent hydrolase of the beta-lactamase fold-like protein [Candidatus Magasanikbacteria bacterium GW2011_GWE2_42_7]KKT05037.1 MAG: Zn-dependent hydrolase of the beta-lactamase fold-like protein [Candidatus Magasanikbacteria bacterium GW2011_GWD2_43_18]KKT24754.1 MAG: Zn-dependent hydrolase of the beta-lactamase fold-like protein [Candidatus Magasan